MKTLTDKLNDAMRSGNPHAEFVLVSRETIGDVVVVLDAQALTIARLKAQAESLCQSNAKTLLLLHLVQAQKGGG